MIEENNSYKYLVIEDYETIVNQLIEAKQEFSEDIPPFHTRYEGKLESIIAQVQAEYFGEELYKTLEEKASILFYLIIKNHPLLNGNKRVAVMAYFVFLAMNSEELYFDEETIQHELYEIATITAASFPDEKDEVLEMLNVKTRQYLNFK